MAEQECGPCWGGRSLRSAGCGGVRRFAGILVAVCAVGCAGPAQSLPGWDLVWSDEFEQADGSVPDPAKWGYDIGGWGWGNAERQYYTDRAENARIEGGQLIIEAREESFGDSNYTSARLLTQDKWAWKYGRIEARIQVPRGQGIWPAFWMLGADFDSVGWPGCGEIDIMEHIGREPRAVHGTLHGPGYSGANGVGGSTTFPVDVADEFHVFAIEWEENEIRWFVDDNHYFTATPASVRGSDWVFDHPFFVILNVAVGGHWPGYPDETTVFPQRMLVDYVRVYARTPEPGANALANPGFEAGVLSPWVGNSPPGGANGPGGYVESTDDFYYCGQDCTPSVPVLTRTGTYTAKTFGDFFGTPNSNGFYQDVSAQPGSRWVAEGWALSHQQDLMAGGNTAWIQVEFLDGVGEVRFRARSEVLEAGSFTESEWVPLAVTHWLDPATSAVTNTSPVLTAPAGTATVRYQVVFRQPDTSGGALYLDDLSLVPQPGPAPVTVMASAEEQAFRLAFDTQDGYDYRIVSGASPMNMAWNLLDTVPGDGAPASFAAPIDQPWQFYAVEAY